MNFANNNNMKSMCSKYVLLIRNEQLFLEQFIFHKFYSLTFCPPEKIKYQTE